MCASTEKPISCFYTLNHFRDQILRTNRKAVTPARAMVQHPLAFILPFLQSTAYLRTCATLNNWPGLARLWWPTDDPGSSALVFFSQWLTSSRFSCCGLLKLLWPTANYCAFLGLPPSKASKAQATSQWREGWLLFLVTRRVVRRYVPQLYGEPEEGWATRKGCCDSGYWEKRQFTRQSYLGGQLMKIAIMK